MIDVVADLMKGQQSNNDAHAIRRQVEQSIVEKDLKLKVNQEQSAVARPWTRTFLGCTFWKVRGRMRICLPE